VIGVECWRCEKPGHVAADCQPPPAATAAEVEKRNARYIERWDAGYGVISTAQKTAWIAAEWKAFHAKEKAK